jgi:hypothetical protein
MAYTTIDNPELFFQTKLYTGTGSSQSITLDGDENMQPDWVWLKDRDGTNQNFVYDSVRGVTKELNTETNQAEQTKSGGLTAFGSDGFTLGDYSGSNNSSTNYVSWNWKAGTAFSNDASATSVGTIDSSGSVSTTAGFSIISYTGNGTANQSVAHGLGAVPKFIINKPRNDSGHWSVTNPRFLSVSDPNMMYLQLTSAEADDTNVNGEIAPSSTVFGVDDYTGVNTNNQTQIAYCFTPIKGYSAMGSYTGNGNADGPFVYTGFKPAMIIIKLSSGSDNWTIYDSKRDGFNGDTHALFPNTSDAQTTDVDIDLLSNGFKIVRASGRVNTSAGTHIYMAFAESPFVNSKGVPTNAR